MIKDKLYGAFLGLAVGDAVGTTVEFRERDTFEPVTDMTGGGPFNLPVGYWTDDTSMALCLAESLVKDPLLDTNDLLQRFSNWFRKGENSPTGRCFDIGTTTRTGIVNWEKTGSVVNNTKVWDAGNGSIMRLAPVAIKYHDDEPFACLIAISQGSTTHGSAEANTACEVLTRVLLRAFNASEKNEVISLEIKDYWEDSIKNIFSTLDVSRDEVSSSGYVIDTLHAALWCFNRTDNFKDAILLAANLGDDADTVAAVTGQIAGAYYGMEGIPTEWLDKLYQTERFIELVDKLTDGK